MDQERRAFLLFMTSLFILMMLVFFLPRIMKRMIKERLIKILSREIS